MKILNPQMKKSGEEEKDYHQGGWSSFLPMLLFCLTFHIFAGYLSQAREQSKRRVA
jgi:hypothetical protein